jgi:hypothetical protein
VQRLADGVEFAAHSAVPLVLIGRVLRPALGVERCIDSGSLMLKDRVEDAEYFAREIRAPAIGDARARVGRENEHDRAPETTAIEGVEMNEHQPEAAAPVDFFATRTEGPAEAALSEVVELVPDARFTLRMGPIANSLGDDVVRKARA